MTPEAFSRVDFWDMRICVQLNPVQLHALQGHSVDKEVLICVKRVDVCSGRGEPL